MPWGTQVPQLLSTWVAVSGTGTNGGPFSSSSNSDNLNGLLVFLIPPSCFAKVKKAGRTLAVPHGTVPPEYTPVPPAPWQRAERKPRLRPSATHSLVPGLEYPNPRVSAPFFKNIHLQ